MSDGRLDRLFPASEVRRIVNEADALFRDFGVPPASLSAGHRLRRVYEATTRDLAAHGSDASWEHLPDAIELGHTTRILRHSRSRKWLDAASLRDASNYRHDLTLMAAATYVAEAGNDVRPNPPAARKALGGRPDMWIHIDSTRGAIEHKAPHRLDEAAALSALSADRVVADAFERAAHQITAAPFALVSLGGLRVPQAHLDELRLAAERHFATAPTEFRHVVGVLAFSIGMARDELPGALPGVFGDRHPGVGIHAALATEVDPRRFGGLVVARVARNQHYNGSISIRNSGDTTPGFYMPFAR